MEENKDQEVKNLNLENSSTRPRFLIAFFKKHKRSFLIASFSLLLFIFILFLVPITRNKILGLFIQKSIVISVLDSKTKLPISNAEVTIEKDTKKSNNNGKAFFNNLLLGDTLVLLKKNNYDSKEELIKIDTDSHSIEILMNANGKSFELTLIDYITKEKIEKATATINSDEYESNDEGKITLSLPLDKKDQKLTIKKDSYEDYSKNIDIDKIKDKETIELIPNKTVYYIKDNLDGKEIVKTNLSGKYKEPLYKEPAGEKIKNNLFINNNYLAFITSNNHNDTLKIIDIDTNEDKVQANQSIKANTLKILGWNNENIILIQKNHNILFQIEEMKLISYNPKNNKTTVIDTSILEGDPLNYASQNITEPDALINGQLNYLKFWHYSNGFQGNTDRQISFMKYKNDKLNEFKQIKTDRSINCHSTLSSDLLLHYSCINLDNNKIINLTQDINSETLNETNDSLGLTNKNLEFICNAKNCFINKQNNEIVHISLADSNHTNGNYTKNIIKTNAKVLNFIDQDHFIYKKDNELYISSVNKISFDQSAKILNQ